MPFSCDPHVNYSYIIAGVNLIEREVDILEKFLTPISYYPLLKLSGQCVYFYRD